MDIWTIQEFCLRDCNDCPDCGGGLYHHSSSFISEAAARQSIEENLRELMTHEIENLDTDKVEFTISIVENTNIPTKQWDVWKHEAYVGEQFSQWYYQMYRESSCDHCGEYTAIGHIH